MNYEIAFDVLVLVTGLYGLIFPRTAIRKSLTIMGDRRDSPFTFIGVIVAATVLTAYGFASLLRIAIG